MCPSLRKSVSPALSTQHSLLSCRSSSLCRVEVSRAFPSPCYHVYCCHHHLAQVCAVMLVRLSSDISRKQSYSKLLILCSYGLSKWPFLKTYIEYNLCFHYTLLYIAYKSYIIKYLSYILMYYILCIINLYIIFYKHKINLYINIQ